MESERIMNDTLQDTNGATTHEVQHMLCGGRCNVLNIAQLLHANTTSTLIASLHNQISSLSENQIRQQTEQNSTTAQLVPQHEQQPLQPQSLQTGKLQLEHHQHEQPQLDKETLLLLKPEVVVISSRSRGVQPNKGRPADVNHHDYFNHKLGLEVVEPKPNYCWGHCTLSSPIPTRHKGHDGNPNQGYKLANSEHIIHGNLKPPPWIRSPKEIALREICSKEDAITYHDAWAKHAREKRDLDLIEGPIFGYHPSILKMEIMAKWAARQESQQHVKSIMLHVLSTEVHDKVDWLAGPVMPMTQLDRPVDPSVYPKDWEYREYHPTPQIPELTPQAILNEMMLRPTAQLLLNTVYDTQCMHKELLETANTSRLCAQKTPELQLPNGDDISDRVIYKTLAHIAASSPMEIWKRKLDQEGTNMLRNAVGLFRMAMRANVEKPSTASKLNADELEAQLHSIFSRLRPHLVLQEPSNILDETFIGVKLGPAHTLKQLNSKRTPEQALQAALTRVREAGHQGTIMVDEGSGVTSHHTVPNAHDDVSTTGHQGTGTADTVAGVTHAQHVVSTTGYRDTDAVDKVAGVTPSHTNTVIQSTPGTWVPSDAFVSPRTPISDELVLTLQKGIQDLRMISGANGPFPLEDALIRHQFTALRRAMDNVGEAACQAIGDEIEKTHDDLQASSDPTHKAPCPETVMETEFHRISRRGLVFGRSHGPIPDLTEAAVRPSSAYSLTRVQIQTWNEASDPAMPDLIEGENSDTDDDQPDVPGLAFTQEVETTYVPPIRYNVYLDTIAPNGPLNTASEQPTGIKATASAIHPTTTQGIWNPTVEHLYTTTPAVEQEPVNRPPMYPPDGTRTPPQVTRARSQEDDWDDAMSELESPCTPEGDASPNHNPSTYVADDGTLLIAPWALDMGGKKYTSMLIGRQNKINIMINETNVQYRCLHKLMTAKRMAPSAEGGAESDAIMATIRIKTRHIQGAIEAALRAACMWQCGINEQPLDRTYWGGGVDNQILKVPTSPDTESETSIHWCDRYPPMRVGELPPHILGDHRYRPGPNDYTDDNESNDMDALLSKQLAKEMRAAEIKEKGRDPSVRSIKPFPILREGYHTRAHRQDPDVLDSINISMNNVTPAWIERMNEAAKGPEPVWRAIMNRENRKAAAEGFAPGDPWTWTDDTTQSQPIPRSTEASEIPCWNCRGGHYHNGTPMDWTHCDQIRCPALVKTAAITTARRLRAQTHKCSTPQHDASLLLEVASLLPPDIISHATAAQVRARRVQYLNEIKTGDTQPPLPPLAALITACQDISSWLDDEATRAAGAANTIGRIVRGRQVRMSLLKSSRKTTHIKQGNEATAFAMANSLTPQRSPTLTQRMPKIPDATKQVIEELHGESQRSFQTSEESQANASASPPIRTHSRYTQAEYDAACAAMRAHSSQFTPGEQAAAYAAITALRAASAAQVAQRLVTQTHQPGSPHNVPPTHRTSFLIQDMPFSQPRDAALYSDLDAQGDTTGKSPDPEPLGSTTPQRISGQLGVNQQINQLAMQFPCPPPTRIPRIIDTTPAVTRTRGRTNE